MERCKVCNRLIWSGNLCKDCETEQKRKETAREEERQSDEHQSKFLSRAAEDAMRPIVQASEFADTMSQAFTLVFRIGRQCTDGNLQIEMTKEQKELFDRVVGFFAFPFVIKRNGLNEDTYACDLSDPIALGYLMMNLSIILTKMACTSSTNISASYIEKYESVYRGCIEVKELAIVMAKQSRKIEFELREKHFSKMLQEYYETTEKLGFDSYPGVVIEKI